MWSTTNENVDFNHSALPRYLKVATSTLCLFLLSIVFVPVVSAEPPLVSIGNPRPGKVLSGVASYYGWAVGETHPVQSVKFFIDGGSKEFAVGYGGDREDVAVVYPDAPDANRSGFAAAVNTRLLTNGPHTLDVVATNTNGETATTSVDFLVSNAPGTETPSSVVMDVMGAQFEAVNQTEFILTGVNINGQPLDTTLKFDPSSNHFVMASFVEDYDGDGLPDDPPTLIGAGDIAECGPGTEATAQLLDQLEGTIFTTGDNAYEKGKMSEFLSCYEPTWGRHKDRTRPSPGNHEYKSSGAKPYYEYFGENAGPAGRGYYSYDVGAWHVISLNSNISAGGGSAQVKWLREDLAANPTTCTVAYWHHPVFSSGKHGNDGHMQEVWRVLYEFGADVVVNGHDHVYERFAPQTPDSEADPVTGIREFVVGTGGKGLSKFKKIRANSEVREKATYGLLKLTLYETSYDWEFMPIAGQTFSDSGSDECVF